MLAAITHESHGHGSHGSRNHGTGPRHGTTNRLSRFVISSARTHTDTHTGPDRRTHTNTCVIDTNARDARYAAAAMPLHCTAAPAPVTAPRHDTATRHSDTVVRHQHRYRSRQHDTDHGATPRCCAVLHWH